MTDATDNSEEPTDEGGLRFTVHPREWQRFQFHSLRRRVQEELIRSQQIWPADGSSLLADESYLKGFKASFLDLIVTRLFSTFDHLQLATWSIEETGTPLVFSQFSLLRSALTGAATAHWLVSGNEVSRRLRALRLAFYDVNQELTFGKLHIANPAMQHPSRSEAFQNATEFVSTAPNRLEALYEEYCRLLRTTGKTKMPTFDGFGTINETTIIGDASKMMHSRGAYSHPTEVELQYRLMSGFVHNCVWATRTGSKVRTTIAEDRAQRQLAGNVENIYNGAVAAFKIGQLAQNRALELASVAVD